MTDRPSTSEDVRRLGGQRAAEQPDGLGRVGAVDVGVQREGDGDLALAAAPRRSPGGRGARCAGRSASSARGGRRRRRGASSRRVLVVTTSQPARTKRPVAGDRVARRPGPRAGGPAVEDHAALGGERVEQRVVGRARARGLGQHADGAHLHASMTATAAPAGNWERTLNFAVADPHKGRVRPICRSAGKVFGFRASDRTWSVPRVVARCPISTSSHRSLRRPRTTPR